MRAWLGRLLLAALVVGLAYWAWRAFFPTPEKVIRKRLIELANTASFSPKEGLLTKAAHADKLRTFFDEAVEVIVDVPGFSRLTLSGREDLLEKAMGARLVARGLQIEFLDIHVSVAPDKASAEAELTARATVLGEKDTIVQELKFNLIKTPDAWLIRRIETVKTLL